jgi:hypothetical protein
MKEDHANIKSFLIFDFFSTFFLLCVPTVSFFFQTNSFITEILLNGYAVSVSPLIFFLFVCFHDFHS